MESSEKNGNFIWVRELKRKVLARSFKPFLLLSAMILLVGSLSACGGGSGSGGGVTGVTVTGQVNGGLNSISGSTVTLWVAGGSSGSATAAGTPVKTATDGTFTISASVPSSSFLYLTASGGTATTTGSNSNILLMTTLGTSGPNLPKSVVINEFTTAVATYTFLTGSKQTYFQGVPEIGGSLSTLQNSQSNVTNYLNIGKGSLLSTVPTTSVNQITAIANILASCVEDVSAGFLNCQNLEADSKATTSSGQTISPTNTLMSLADIVEDSSSLSNSSGVLSLASTSTSLSTSSSLSSLPTSLPPPTSTSTSGGSSTGSSGTGSGGSTTGSGGTGAGSGSTTNIGSLVIATSASSGSTQLTTFTYDAAGTITNSSSPLSMTIPATSTNGCAGAINYSIYDKTDKILFLDFSSGSSTIVICSYTVNPTTGQITFANAIPPLTGTGFGLDIPDRMIIGGSGGSAFIYFYSTNGTFTQGSIIGSTPSPYFPIQADFPNHILWYGSQSGTSGSGNQTSTFEGSCPFSISGTTMTIGTCTPYSSSFTIPNNLFEIDSTNGLLFYTDSVPSNCSTTSISAHILDYNISNGVFTNPSTPTSESIGTCSYILYNPDNGSGDADLTDSLFFGDSYINSQVITPFPFSTSGTFGTSAPPLQLSTTPTINGGTLDRVNHLVFILTGSNASGVSTVTGVNSYPYTASGFTSTNQMNSLKFSNNTFSCVQGSNCPYGLIAILH